MTFTASRRLPILFVALAALVLALVGGPVQAQANPAELSGSPPEAPANQRYEYDGSAIVLTWDASADADSYTVYYDDFFGSSCELLFGEPLLCEELASNITSTTYTHMSPDETANYYWITACNDAGCSAIDSENPAKMEGAAPSPDLVVDTPTVSESAPAAGARFTLNATVRNQGNGSSASTTLRYYRSSDSTVSAADTELGSDYVSRLDPLESGDESISVTAPSDAGTYYYGACVDSVSDESDTTNNCSVAVTVTVGAAPSPDLVVDTPTVSESAPAAGARFTLNATVRNQGNGSSASTTLRYYRSSDSTVSAADTELGSDYVSRLDPLESGDESISVTAPSDAGTYYYGACVDSVSDESDTTNNCSVAVTVTVGAAPSPDLVVDMPTVSESAPAAGARFTLNATVRNQGNGSSASTTLRYYRSSDSTVSAADTELGSDYVSRLDPLESGAESIGLTAPSTAGTYYYGACVEPVEEESDTTNNCSAALAVTVSAAPAPDLVVDAPTVDTGAPAAGARFTLSAAVRNQGDGRSGTTTLRYYRSSDSTVSAADTELGSDYVSRLDPLESSAESIGLEAPSTAGTYYYGACVEPVEEESDTTNNCSAAVAVTVGVAPAPDLVVDAPTVDTGAPAAGARFTLSAAVRNQGDGRSGTTTLRYYRSSDSTVSAADTELGSDYVSRLDPLESSAESIGLEAPSTAGTYYYGACVEPVEEESDTTNNCSAAVAVTVGVAPAPDLVVRHPSLGGGIPIAGQSFLLNATVDNQGSASSARTTIRYYLSLDSTITTGDTQISADSVVLLGARGGYATSARPTAPPMAGTYYYGACVDAVSAESDTTNNCSPALAVTVSAAPVPDLVADAPTVDTGAPAAGARFTLSALVRNQGDGPSATTSLRYYRSADATITAEDTEVGSDYVSPLNPLQSRAESIALSAPSTPGTYYYGACVKAVSAESDTTNNCSLAATITVGAAPAPDVVLSTPRVSDSTPKVGASFSLAVTAENQGSASSQSATLRFYRSNDSTISSSDTELSRDSIPTLDPGGGFVSNANPMAPPTSGTYYYGACVETVADEFDTTNNCSVAVAVTVGAAPAPDLVVRQPSLGGDILTAGQSFLLNATVDNQGSASSTRTTIRYYLSLDSTITTGDTQISADSVVLLGARGGYVTSTRPTAPPMAGTYYYGACVDAVSAESDTTNNCSPALAVTVSAAPAPDLVADAPTVDPGAPAAGARFTLSASVRNQGDGPSAFTTLRYYRSTDSTITTGDTVVGTGSMSGLGPSGSKSESISLTAPTMLGAYYYGICVDASSDESDTTNNCSPALAVTVSAAPAPDLVADAPTVDPGAPAAGARFTLSASVRNQGDGPSAFTTLRYYRSTDSTITTGDTVVGTGSMSGLGPSGSKSESISLTAPTMLGAYYYGICVDASSDESDTTNNCSPAVAVTVGAAPAPDLVVGAPTVDPGAPAAGARFTLSASVRNQGDGPSAFTTLRYYRSTDSTITTGDTDVGSGSVSGLSPSGSRDQSINLTAPSTPGTHYYGSCVEATADESNTTNNCSLALAVNVVDGTTYEEGDFLPGVPTTGIFVPAVITGASLSSSGASTTITFTNGGYIELLDGTRYTCASTDGCEVRNGIATQGTLLSQTPSVSTADFVVEPPTVSQSAPTAGATFTLETTVRNQGSDPAGSTTLNYYRSTDSTITASDTLVGTSAVAALAGYGSRAESISLTAPLIAGPYYYGACLEATADESDTQNNCSSAVTVTVSATRAPDLIVDTPNVSDSSATGGETLTLWATVRNQGQGSADSTLLHHYRSTDAPLAMPETSWRRNNIYVEGLGPSESRGKWLDFVAPLTAGIYYYAVCVDSVTGESDTTNNCSDAVTVTVGGPDLVMGAPTVDTEAPAAGAGFTLSAAVRNQGSGRSDSTTVRYFRSPDSTITIADTEVGSASVSRLDPSQNGDESITLYAPSSAGSYYYGACVGAVPAESDTTNNCSPAVAVTVGATPAPDLVVRQPSLGGSSPIAGQSFLLNVTVDNRGSAPSVSTTLRYYRSSDSTISDSDTSVGTAVVADLAGSESIAESINLTAPSTPGVYYYGACVTAVADESDTQNNCSAAKTVTVDPAPAPDLVVDAPTVGGNAPVAGTGFTLVATVGNQGDGYSASTNLRFYRSSDPTISDPDTSVGTAVVAGLAGSESIAVSTNPTAPSTPGVYYYGACVDAVADESNTQNNCSAAITVAVGPAPAPDLVVDAPTVDSGAPAMGAGFALMATARNQGDGRSASTNLHYYQSSDSTISRSDTSVGTAGVSGLAGYESVAESINLTAPPTPGVYYYGACVEVVADESDTQNNCSIAVSVTVGAAPAPDLVPETPTPYWSSVAPGAPFSIRGELRNQGSVSVRGYIWRFYLSTDATISEADTAVGTGKAWWVLEPSGSIADSINLTAPSTPGTYYYGVCVDAVPDESDTQNNCSDALTLIVGGAPDLVLDTPVISDNALPAEASFTLSVTVRNQGSVSSTYSSLRIYRSPDSTITTSDTVSDTVLGSHYVVHQFSLGPLGSTTYNPTLAAPSTAGTYYYGACVDPVWGESDTANNCSAGVAVTVSPVPDLVVDTLTVSNSSPVAGTSFTLTATVRNRGEKSSPTTTLRYYQIDRQAVIYSSQLVSSTEVSGLVASGASVESISLTAPTEPGTYDYKVCASRVEGEPTDTSNCSDRVRVTVVLTAPAPDLVVVAPTATQSHATVGSSLSMRTSVRNQGNEASDSSTVRFFHSTDSTITTDDADATGSQVVDIGALDPMEEQSIRSRSVRTPNSAGTYYYGACVVPVAGEANIENNCSSAVAIVVGQPDLVVDPPTVTERYEREFVLEATVRNQGNGFATRATVTVMISTDGTITRWDQGNWQFFLTTGDYVKDYRLDVSESAVAAVALTEPNTPGVYYYGFCVDSANGDSNGENDCSEAVKITVGAAHLVLLTPNAGDRDPAVGATFSLLADVGNPSDSLSDFTTLHFYRSTDAAITDSDTWLSSESVDSLSAYETISFRVSLQAPPTQGTYYYYVCVEEKSNCSALEKVTVGAAKPPPLKFRLTNCFMLQGQHFAQFQMTAQVRLENLVVKTYQVEGRINNKHLMQTINVGTLAAGASYTKMTTKLFPAHLRPHLGTCIAGVEWEGGALEAAFGIGTVFVSPPPSSTDTPPPSETSPGGIIIPDRDQAYALFGEIIDAAVRDSSYTHLMNCGYSGSRPCPNNGYVFWWLSLPPDIRDCAFERCTFP